ncbi:MarR family transcriptional regulator [Kocuria tytonicola]|uniref:MarR family transcriptional regulator n=1 Tax=Kocuria tytonicola TaxID=2055946 RepID=A0A3L9L6L4_9MICC|nr:MarR family winged helix-turn-helix transcriptional regulator [Kocuria tytonicola]RLY94201.1 MarR family transcriptional regulator [Kocuria tytonicola]
MDSSATPGPTPWLSPAEEDVWRSFLRLTRGMERAVDRQLQRDSELSGSEYEILVPLSESTTGELPSRELLRGLRWERSRLSHMLSRMERRGMIRRSPSPTDARGLVVGITEHGREAIGRAAPAHLAMVREAFMDQLSEEERTALLSITRKVMPRLERMDLV